MREGRATIRRWCAAAIHEPTTKRGKGEERCQETQLSEKR